jgi:hypothetical protein
MPRASAQLQFPFPQTEQELKTMAQFSDILDKPATEIDRPKPLPVGSYVWSIIGMPRFDKSKEKQTPFYEFQVKPVSALDDVDEEALKEWATKSDGTMRQLSDYTTRLTFYITEDSLYRLQEFIEHCGIDGEDKTTRQCIDETPNCQFVGNIVHTASKDGSTVYANIGKTAPVEE